MGIRVSAIADFLRCEAQGPDVEVDRPASLAGIAPGTLVFCKHTGPDYVGQLAAVPLACAVVGPDLAAELDGPRIVSSSPRGDFARAAQKFFAPPRPTGVQSTAVVSPDAEIGKDVYIGHLSVIDGGVRIGDGTVVMDHVILRRGTKVGRNCWIKSKTVIGEAGFGFDFDEDGTPIRVPHFGGVTIGDETEIGALNAIARGTLDDTVIGDHVKTDDHVFIAHNVQIGARSVVIAGAEISGSVRIGEGAWISPQACIRNQLTIGDGALVGMGAVVTKSVEDGVIVAGNPAKVLRKR